MKRPSLQFYPSDWQSNHKLKRCGHAEKGAWMDILCLLHDSDEYGILRWELSQIAQAIGTKIKIVESLVSKHILKGKPKDTIGNEPKDPTHLPFGFTPRHGGKASEEVILIPNQDGPLWFSSRLVVDEYIRNTRGKHGSKSLEHPNVPQPKDTIGKSIGGSLGGSPSSSPSSSKDKVKDKGSPPYIPPEGDTQTAKVKRACTLPNDFSLSDSLRSWAIKTAPALNIDQEFEHFTTRCRAKGEMFKDWDHAFRSWIFQALKFSKGGNNAAAGKGKNSGSDGVSGREVGDRSDDEVPEELKRPFAANTPGEAKDTVS